MPAVTQGQILITEKTEINKYVNTNVRNIHFTDLVLTPVYR